MEGGSVAFIYQGHLQARSPELDLGTTQTCVLVHSCNPSPRLLEAGGPKD